jgi:DNA invertase Pin-like site-specific DNA recombinase
MLIGYARISTPEQSLDSQLDALKTAGCEKCFSDIASGANSTRQGLDEALRFLREGDTLVVWKLDRLGRSLQHLLDTLHTLNARQIGFRSLQENLDTTTASGKLLFHLFGALAEFERDLIRERTHAGLAAARARGKLGGRRRSLDDKKITLLKSLHAHPDYPIADLCQSFRISRATLYRYLKNETPAESSGTS